MFGARGGMAVHTRRFDGGLRPVAKLQFRLWVEGLTAFTAISTVIWLVLGRLNSVLGFNIVGLLEIGIALAALTAYRKRYQNAEPSVLIAEKAWKEGKERLATEEAHIQEKSHRSNAPDNRNRTK